MSATAINQIRWRRKWSPKRIKHCNCRQPPSYSSSVFSLYLVDVEKFYFYFSLFFTFFSRSCSCLIFYSDQSKRIHRAARGDLEKQRIPSRKSRTSRSLATSPFLESFCNRRKSSFAVQWNQIVLKGKCPIDQFVDDVSTNGIASDECFASLFFFLSYKFVCSLWLYNSRSNFPMPIIVLDPPSKEKSEQSTSATENKDSKDDDDEDHVTTAIIKTGCFAFHEKLQECYIVKRDWRDCAKEMQEFRQCMQKIQRTTPQPPTTKQ